MTIAANIAAHFPAYNPIGPEESAAAQRVLSTGLLSDFLGRAGDKFGGGKHVLEFERAWAEAHGVKHAITFNSATSGLIAAVGALGLLPGDEVIVGPYSMCISATAPLIYDAIPVFADIEPDLFCLDPADVEAKITTRTKAILAVDLFGQSADMVALRDIADRHGLKIISDAAHAPGCRYLEGWAGTYGDIGVYSFNQHKIIHCGEGGVAVTNDDELALRLQLLRNHGEWVVGEIGRGGLRNMVGGNLRMPEIEAAIMSEQLKKMPRLIQDRVDLARTLGDALAHLDFLSPPTVRDGSEHVYYLYPIRFLEEAAGFTRAEYGERLAAAGLSLYRFALGYVQPLYLDPVFQEPQQFKEGFPFNLSEHHQPSRYARGACPVTERMHRQELIVTAYNYPPLTRGDMRSIASAFERAALDRSKVRA